MTESLHKFADIVALAHAGAEAFRSAAEEAIQERGRFIVALAGGSTPRVLHEILARDYRDQLRWGDIRFVFGDERSVPPDHSDSNYRMARETLFDPLGIAADQVYRIEAELEPPTAAGRYEAALRSLFPDLDWPRFDLVFLGMGDDGHTASLFAGTAAAHETRRWAVENFVPKLNSWRVTLSAPAVNAAQQVIFMAAGANKADTLREVINGPYLPETYPAQLIEPVDGRLTWLVDAAAGEWI